MALNLVGVIVFLGVIALLYRAVAIPGVSVSTLSVPKVLAEKGYTPEVAALELRKALNAVIHDANSEKRVASIVGAQEEPSIVVPQTGLSLETIGYEIRRLFRVQGFWAVTGDITVEGDDYALSLNLNNGLEAKNISTKMDKSKLNALFRSGAENVMGVVDPYILAASLSDSDPERATAIADRIIYSSFKNQSLSAWAHMLKSNINSDKQDWDDAIGEAKAAIALEPHFALAHWNLAFSYEMKAEHAEAIADLTPEIAFDPKNPDLELALGDVYMAQSNSTEAIKAYQKAVDLNPDDYLGHHDLAAALQAAGNENDAVLEFERAAAVNPEFSQSHLALGFILERQGKTPAAVREYQSAIGASDLDATPHAKLGLLFLRQRDFDHALPELLRYIALSPADPAAHYNLGFCLAQKSRFADAVAEFQTVLKMEPRDEAAQQYLAYSLLALNRIDDAIVELRKALDINAADPWTNQQLAAALKAKEALDGAKEQAQPANQVTKP